MAGAGGRGIGWVVLAVLLAVPGFYTYSSWSRQKAEHDRGVSAKARTRLPEGGVFQSPPPAADRLVNPISAKDAVAKASAAPKPPAATKTPAAPAAVKVPAAAPAPTASLEAASAVPSIVATASAAPVALVRASVAKSTAAAVALRDPTLSPLDVVRLQEMADEKARREREDRERLHPRAAAPKRLARIEDLIKLEGTVAKADGHVLAIVNGTMLSAGESFRVRGYDAKVKVVSISTAVVVFEFQKRRFKKSVSTSIGR